MIEVFMLNRIKCFRRVLATKFFGKNILDDVFSFDPLLPFPEFYLRLELESKAFSANFCTVLNFDLQNIKSFKYSPICQT